MSTFTIKIDIQRYGKDTRAAKNYPLEFKIEGFTKEQAEELCYELSLMDAGCSDNFYIYPEEF